MMKKNYISPVVEKIQFDYRDQVLAKSNANCSGIQSMYTTQEHAMCTDPEWDMQKST